MCFKPKIPKDNSAAIAADKEAQRQTNIKSGQQAIDKNFSQFDDPYYANITKNYEDYYNPQVDQQYGDAYDKLVAQLGQQGILQSTEGNRQLGQAEQQKQRQKQTIADQGIAAANTARQQVAQSKNNLYQLNTTAADPSQAASQSASAASSVVSPITFSPLANIFAGLIGQGTNALALQTGSNIGNQGNGSFLTLPANTAALNKGATGESGSGKVVN